MKRTILGLAIVAVLSSVTAAQIRVDVALFTIVATVMDQHGRYVSTLTAGDFIVEEDDRRQDVSHLTRSNDLPISMGIVLDISPSMEGKISTAIKAVDRFIRDIHPEDDIFFMTFDENPRVRQNFTSDRERLSAALYKTKLGSGTALYDAVIEALDKLKKGKYNKKAILLISDGVDTSSERDLEVALLATRQSEALVYCLGVSPERFSRFPSRPPSIPGTGPSILIPAPGIAIPLPLPGPGRRATPAQLPQPRARRMPNMNGVDMRVLDAFADASGGNSWLITSGEGRTNQISDALEFIADELRSQYTIGYYPEHPLNDGRWHRVEIRTRNPAYYVRSKKEYFGQ